MSRFVIKHIIVEGHKEKIEYEEKIESMDKCKRLINGLCYNNECEYVVEPPDIGCDNKEECEYFEKEDGIIEVIE